MEKHFVYHIIAYFIQNTENCKLTKLLKLLYFFDLEHVKETGVSATNLKYQAWALGPVSPEIRNKIISFNDTDFLNSFDVDISESPSGGDSEIYTISPKFEFDEDLFSDRQIEILERLSFQYKKSTASELIKKTHEKGELWNIVHKKGENLEIPFHLQIEKETDLKKREFLRAKYEEFK